VSKLGDFKFLGAGEAKEEKTVDPHAEKIRKAMKRVMKLKDSSKSEDRIRGIVAVRAMARSRKTAKATRESLKAKVK
jgi:hypothetical protein